MPTQTLDGIINDLTERVTQNIEVSPREWIEAASVVNLLLLDLNSMLVKAEMALNKEIASEMAKGTSAAAARVLGHCTASYENWAMLKLKREQILEFIKLSKKRVELSRWEG